PQETTRPAQPVRDSPADELVALPVGRATLAGRSTAPLLPVPGLSGRAFIPHPMSETEFSKAVINVTRCHRGMRPPRRTRRSRDHEHDPLAARPAGRRL